MYILGISAYYHDSAATLICDGKIIAAAQEERFTRIKNDSSFPQNSIKFCLDFAGIDLSDISYISFYDKPFLKFERIIETFLLNAPRGLKSFSIALPLWVKEKLFLKNTLIKNLKKTTGLSKKEISKKMLFSEHHLSHAASSYYPSPFDKSAIITIDGVGEWTTTSISIGEGNNIKVLKEISFPHSVGLLYSAFTFYCGFEVNSGEYKLMGLAPYGRAIYSDLIKEELIEIYSDGSFKLNTKYFDYMTGERMINNSFEELFKHSARSKGQEITQFYMDVAASIQCVTEEIILKICEHAKEITNCDSLCFAGGVALNCVANGKILASQLFKELWIQPAPGDAGGSLGSAYCAYYMHLNNELTPKGKTDLMESSLLGPQDAEEEVEKFLIGKGVTYRRLEDADLFAFVSTRLSQAKVIGWQQGRAEFGPRALGNRSILGDPRNPKMKEIMNSKIKKRESFRPFAPVVIETEFSNWFSGNSTSQYMQIVSSVKECKRESIPSVTHVDGSARVQTVSYSQNLRLYKLLESFYKLTECPILINTSFNVRGEPIVNSYQDSYRCFMNTGIDILVIGNLVIEK
ncbi:carbamoyltransferase [Halobacteriovorax sp. HLS]|uniref:carbamoyltransferase family protein n=1 Tax=Halobacteriovorax sp. HLS TaxID=2234000 RepID=UPI000FDB8174|nr:carbamoyltransferase [Halobacteriovorax sp. HLS]